jgi:hypothetical protein
VISVIIFNLSKRTQQTGSMHASIKVSSQRVRDNANMHHHVSVSLVNNKINTFINWGESAHFTYMTFAL